MAVELKEPGTKRSGLIRREIAVFWDWYERNYAINVSVATFLFVLQLVHLTWLSLHVVATRLFDHSYFPASGLLLGLLVIVDMLEMPALVSVSLVYINELRQKRNLRSLVYLVMLNSQWIHILWITDEFVVDRFGGAGPAWPVWLAWVAIGIDYLELPVMLDTARRFLNAMAGRESLRQVFRPEDRGRRRRLRVLPSVYCPGLELVRSPLTVVSDADGRAALGPQAIADDDAMCCSDVVS